MEHKLIRQKISELGLLLDVRAAHIEAVIDAFLKAGKTLDTREGTVLLNEGDERGNVGFILVEGTAKVNKSDGVETSVEGPALIGEMQQFSISGTRSATVRLTTPATVINFDWSNFYDELAAALRPHEVQGVREAIRRQSWQHFLDSETD